MISRPLRGQHRVAAHGAAAAALVVFLQLGRVALVDDQAIVVEQLFACLQLAQRLDEDSALGLVGHTVGHAGVVDPACCVAAHPGVDDVAAIVQAEVKGVVGVGGVMRVAAQGLGPVDDLALVFDDAFAFGDGLQREDTLAMHATFAHLNPARIRSGVGRGRRGHLRGHLHSVYLIRTSARVCARDRRIVGTAFWVRRGQAA